MHTKLRNSWKLGGVGGCLVILEMFAHPSQGALVLREDWNSGRVDSNRWEVVGWPSNSMVVDLGHGDWAMRLQDISRGNAYSMGIRSRFGLLRGDNLRCTFRMWRGNEPLNWNGIGGPFVNRNYLSGESPNLSQVEAGFSRYAAIAGNAGVCWAEGVETFLNRGPRVEAAFMDAWTTATNKLRALGVRVGAQFRPCPSRPLRGRLHQRRYDPGGHPALGVGRGRLLGGRGLLRSQPLD